MCTLLTTFLIIVGYYSFCQSPFSIKGVVTTNADMLVAGAAVSLLNTNHHTVASSNGFYEIDRIAQGQYLLSVSATGFATHNRIVSISDRSIITLDIRSVQLAYRLDDVVVTAEKTSEQSHKVPAAISVISGRQLQDYHLWDVSDMKSFAPNVNLENSGDGRNVTFIRGVGSTSYDQAVATYVNDRVQFDLDTYLPQLLDIERIEILRGPQGTLYGRNAMGGVINIITKGLASRTSGYAEASLGNDGQQRYQISLRSPIKKDKLSFGVAGMFFQRNGFYTNTSQKKPLMISTITPAAIPSNIVRRKNG